MNQEQRELNAKIKEIEEELEGESRKKRQIEKDINELSIQIATQKNANGGKDESQRVVWLREELVKKQTEIAAAQRQYKELLESKFSPSKVAPGSAAENMNILKLEHDMKQIKDML